MSANIHASQEKSESALCDISCRGHAQSYKLGDVLKKRASVTFG